MLGPERCPEFQSTLPVWGATILAAGGSANDFYFNPRSPCGERQLITSKSRPGKSFQSTLPVWGATNQSEAVLSALIVFQSTLPVWGATKVPPIPPPERGISIHAPRVGSDSTWYILGMFPVISIHAPRVGSDWSASLRLCLAQNFNPRSPCGERRLHLLFIPHHISYFNPRSPCGERL